MSFTQFTMVEELAFLVKDNLPSKHLVLSMEEALINFLEDDNGADGVFELEPMNSYNRLLLHRLADIFGFAHESVGEGNDRHLVLERCPETAIPSILVSDILYQYGEPETLTTPHLLLRRQEASGEVKNESPPTEQSFEEREAAYLAARQRIFSTDEATVAEPVRHKPRNVPVVARRMIAHALGQKLKIQNQYDVLTDSKECRQATREAATQNDDTVGSSASLKAIQDHDRVGSSASLKACQDTIPKHDQSSNSITRANTNKSKHNAAEQSERTTSQQAAEKSCTDVSSSRDRKGKGSSNKEYSKEQHVGAAKRMFAHALGLHSAKDNSHLK